MTDTPDIGSFPRADPPRASLRAIESEHTLPDGPLSSNDNRRDHAAAPHAAAGTDGRLRKIRAARKVATGAIRRRGPLITRWIGFAARRERAQERIAHLAVLHRLALRQPDPRSQRDRSSC